jgi:hypothetical protein
MSVDVDAAKPDRYAWPTVDEETLTVCCSRIARHLSRAGAHAIGLLPVGGELASPRAAGPRLAPLLSRLAVAMVGFVREDVAIIDAWRTWSSPGAPGAAQQDDDGGEEGDEDGGPAAAAEDPKKAADTPRSSRIREIQPRVLEITPPACDDAPAAAVALQNTLKVLRRGVSVVLIHLGGLSSTAAAPAALTLVDGVVLVVSARRSRRASVVKMAEHIPSAKRLGAILVG